MQKEKRKQSKDEEDDSSSRKRRKADLSKPVSFISTASMKEPKSSRSRPKGAYDVFLSFRGEDNRKTFTGHLYTALVQAGVHTFLDENELPRGEEISKHLLKAIQESKISIVIFSKGYASTRWCLNELVEILECKNRKTGHIVLPIFYDIDPSDVRKQTGSFAKAFDKHEECFKEKVKEWRKALEEAGNLSGWNLNDMENRHESKLIQAIIKDVLNKLDPRYINVATNLVGIDRLVQTISDFLSTATNEVCMVGIHGMPGIGKTTIAKVIFNQLCYGFEGSSFLSNINETSEQSNGLVLLQEQLLRDIFKQNVATINNVDRGMVLIKERLCHKRVIIVVDDVAQQYQLNTLVGERSWFGPGSRVIITTKDERLLLKVDKKFQVEELNICDAKSLEILNISECSELEKLPEHIAGMESFTVLLADGINNEQFLASIEHLKYLRKLSLCGYNFNADAPSSTSWPSPISSWISASVLDWKAMLPTCFTSWRLLRKLRLAYYGLSERTTNCVDLGGLFSLEEMNL